MKYGITFDLRRLEVELPDDLKGEALDDALEMAMEAADLDALVVGWDAVELDERGRKPL